MPKAQPEQLPTPPDRQYVTLDPDQLSSVVDSLVDVVRARYGGRLSESDLEEVRACIDMQVAMAETLHAYPLTNADEPAFVFVPCDEEG